MNTTVLIAALAILTIAVMYPNTMARMAPADLCMDADARDKARALMFEGINTALVHHTERMFDNLMKDRGHEPDRMTRGMYTSLALYARSRKTLLEWSPPACKE